ncbi:MAG: hypothetical protein HKM93_12695 [Desulfobacteraceae bacterium]|nr:hypothetical protein [Desulfobacteraceae bacterium]
MQNIRILMLLPLLFAAGHLVSTTIDIEALHFLTVSPGRILPLVMAVLMPVCFAVAAMISNRRNLEYRLLTVLSLCASAPLAVLYPWAIVPGGLGPGLVGYPFF